MKKGLVMEGGAMRGMFTAGVTDVIMENKIEFDGAVGVSAGAAFGCNIKSKQIGRAIRYNMSYCNDKRYCSLYSLITTGDLFGAEFCYHTLPDKLDIFDTETFYSNPMEFYVVCTDVETGKPVYKKIEESDKEFFCEWVRASASLPLISRIVEIQGLKLLDGGIADSIPIKFMESIGYDKNVVILTRPKDYVKGISKSLKLMRLFLKKYPNLVDAIEKRVDIYNETLEYISQKEKEGELFVIRPNDALPIERMESDPMKLKLVYDMGRENIQKRLSKLKEFLN
ncbi:MAG: patatin family protein [Clostridia bacterium]|nr:patatin family protein [Clostridia bacterium]